MQRLADGEVQADLARSYGVSQATISRLSGDRPFGVSASAREAEAANPIDRLLIDELPAPVPIGLPSA